MGLGTYGASPVYWLDQPLVLGFVGMRPGELLEGVCRLVLVRDSGLRMRLSRTSLNGWPVILSIM